MTSKKGRCLRYFSNDLKASDDFSEDGSYRKFKIEPSSHKKTRYTDEHGSSGKRECNEMKSYFDQTFDALKRNLAKEDRDLLAINVLKQTEDKEIEVSCTLCGSRCVQLLLGTCDDISVAVRFMNAFSQDFETVCTNKYASHVLENLLYFGLLHLKDKYSSDYDLNENKLLLEADSVTSIIAWIHNLAVFCIEHMDNCLENQCASHVVLTLIQILGGHYIGEAVNYDAKPKRQKKNFESLDFGHEGRKSFTLEEIPPIFLKDLKKISKFIIKLNNLKEYANDRRSGIVIQTLISILKEKLPKYCAKLVRALMCSLFEDKNNEGIPLAFVDKNCSYVVEKVFEASGVSQQEDIWTSYVSAFLEQLILHPVGNYILQRLFDVVNDKILFETMCSNIYPLFGDILRSMHFGIWFSMAVTCTKLKTQQSQFLINLMQCLDCLEPEEKQTHLVPVILALKTHDAYIDRKPLISSESNIPITLQGSLIVQTLLKFHKPIKIVKSMLNLKPATLAFMACHMQGCFVLTAFFKSENVGQKNKDKLLQNLKPVLTTIACDRSGNLTLARMWVLFSLKQKSVVAEELCKYEDTLEKNRFGQIITKKFGLFHFKNKPMQWKEFQENLTRKRRLSSSDSVIK